MKRMFGGDDEDDFVPANNSKLASLFSSKSVEGNSSLTYTAPKQPKRSSTQNESRTSTTRASNESNRPSKESYENKLSIIVVKAVNTYKFLEGKYALQGKLGAAILGNSTICVYQLLLYKGKQQHITSTKIYPNFQYTVQASNYATFYDDNKQNWSIHFEKSEDAEEFAKEIGLARANAQGGQGVVKSMLTQELFVGEGPAASVGDSMEIFYKVMSFLGTNAEEPIESNLEAEKPQRVKIRKNVWEEGLIGATRGSKRVILLPPNLVGPWKQEVTPDTSIVVEVEVSRLKQARSAAEEARSAAASRVDSGDSAVDSSTDDTSIRARGASISEALTASPKTNKANIISRMAKMGQATLPLKGAIVCHPSDSEETEDEVLHPPIAKPPIIFKPSAKNRSSKVRSKASSPSSPVDSMPPTASVRSTNNPLHQVTVYQPLPVAAWQQQQQQYTMGQYGLGPLDGQLYPLMSQPTASSHQMFPATPNTVVSTPTGVAPSESLFSVFMSEARTQNTEVRMGIAKVTDKVDQVLAKLDTAQSLKAISSNTVLDPSSVLASIQKLVTENEQLKTEIVEKGDKIELQSDRIYQLLNTNHKYLEQSNCSNNDQRTQEALVASLQVEKTRLAEELGECRAQVANLEQENSEITSNMASRLEKLQQELSDCKGVILEQDVSVQKLEEKLRSSLEANEAHEQTMASLRSIMLELQGSKEKAEVCLKDMTHQLRVQKLEAEDCEKKLTAKYSQHIAALTEKEAYFKVQLDRAKKTSSESHVAKPVEEVKKVMNIVYKVLHSEFSPGETYLGEFIRESLQTTIRDVTCLVLETNTQLHTVPSEQVLKTLSVDGGVQVSKELSGISTVLHSNPASNAKLENSHTGLRKTPLEVLIVPLEKQSGTGNVKPREDELEEKCIPSIPADDDKPKTPPLKDSGSFKHGVQGNAPLLVSQAPESVVDTPEPPLPNLPERMESTPEVPPEGKTLGIPVDNTDEGRKECVPATVGPNGAHTGENVCFDKLATNQLEEKINKKLRDSSLERKPWHSEPPPAPLQDDDEDEDYWLN